MELKQSGEDYLEAILVLQKKKGSVLSVDVAAHLGFAKSSVSYAMGLLRDGGFLTVESGGALRLTQAGLEAAGRVYERHCTLKRLLVSWGVDPKTAEEDACRMEHAISAESFEKLKAFLAEE